MRKRSLLIITIITLIISTAGPSFWAWQAWPHQDHIKWGQDYIDISSWKIYRNDELGFEMKMPSIWEIFQEETNQRPPSPHGEVVLGTTSNINYEMKEGIRVRIAVTDYEDYWDGEQPPLVLKDTVLIDGMNAKRRVFFIRKDDKQGSMDPYQAEESLAITPQSVREYIVDAYNSRIKRFYHFYLQSVGKSAESSEYIFDTLLINVNFLQ